MAGQTHKVDTRHQAGVSSPGLFALIREDWVTTGRDWTLPGFQALAHYRFGVWRMCIRLRIFRLPLSFLYRILYVFIRNFYGIELYWTAKIGRRLLLAHQHGIIVHPHSVIGDDCILRQGVTIGSASRYGQAPRIGDNVEMGAGCVIAGDIVIGDNVKIGPNAVVLMNVPSHSTVVATPPRVIKMTPIQRKAS